MKKFWSHYIGLCVLVLSLWTHPSLARTFSLEKLPEDLDQVDIYLHTIDVGNLVFNNFGHTAIRVHNRQTGEDLVLNWGIFDFGEPLSFSLKFYRGILIYKLGIYPFAWVYETYVADKRTVWEDKFLLDSDQKKRFLEKLVWNSKPENREYSYQYFWDNCSTRPRDYLNEAVDGQLQSRTKQQITNESFRDVMVQAYQYNPGMDVLLDLGMNSRLDRPMTVWERMFLPLQLRDALLTTPIDGKPILEATRVLVQAPRPTSYEGLAFTCLLVGFGVGLLFVGILLYFHNPRHGRGAWKYRLWILVSLPLVLWGAFVGFMMPINWLASEHLDLHHNANMWLYWPLDAVLVWYSLRILRAGKALTLPRKQWVWVRTYLLLHLLGSLALPILHILGFVQQDVNRIVVFLLPPYLVHMFWLYRLGFKREEP